MNQLSLRIELTDGTVIEVLSSASDLVKWEAYFNIGIDKLEKVTHLLLSLIHISEPTRQIH
jgi:hypothetical protein